MTRELDLAREVGATVGKRNGVLFGDVGFRAYTARIRQEQREADRVLCVEEKVDAEATGETGDYAYNAACDHCAAAIRAGGDE